MRTAKQRLCSYLDCKPKNNEMKTIKTLVAILVIVLVGMQVNAQDTVKKKNGEVLKVVIKEINDTQVKYYHFDDPNQVLFTVDRAMIDSIEFSYGAKYVEKEPVADDIYFAEDKNMSIKLNMMSLLSDAAMITFEKALTPKSAFEASLKYYGIGFGPGEGEYDSGIGFDLGYKIKFSSLRRNASEYRPKHILHGGYVMPYMAYDYNKSETSWRKKTNNHFSIGLKFGKQHVIQDLLVLDYYAGFGFFGGSSKSINKNSGSDTPYESDELYSADFAGSNNFGVSYGFRVGVPFGKFGESKKKGRR